MERKPAFFFAIGGNREFYDIPSALAYIRKRFARPNQMVGRSRTRNIQRKTPPVSVKKGRKIT